MSKSEISEFLKENLEGYLKEPFEEICEGIPGETLDVFGRKNLLRNFEQNSRRIAKEILREKI